jgi:zinc D-Ala-D-Ala carboxypeptidase
MTEMQLSKNFYLSELTQSQTAARLGISNKPNTVQVANLKEVCVKILQPIRDHFSRPVVVSSGYRSPNLNSQIGGSKTSQHCFGRAVDFEIPSLPNRQVAKWIKDNLDYDQLILEFYDGKDPNSGWVHCSYGIEQRKQALVFNGGKYLTWS